MTPTPPPPQPDAEREAMKLMWEIECSSPRPGWDMVEWVWANRISLQRRQHYLLHVTLTARAERAEAERSVWNARAVRAEERCEGLIRERDAALAREARLREALRPFVAHHEKWMSHYPDTHESSTYARHTFGQLREARAALAAPGGEQASAEGERA